MKQEAASYWDSVGLRWRQGPDSLWRHFTDRAQVTLIRQWLPLEPPASSGCGVSAPAILKTDLFDEVAHRGVVPELLQAGLRVTAMDISPLVVAEAAARHPSLEAVQADVRRLPFPDGRFDAVFSGSTLDHLASKAEIAVALAELARVLRPGGQLILTLDNPGNPLILLRNGPLLRLWRRLGIVPYQVGCTLALGPLLALLRASGFRVREARGFQHCPRLLCVALARACGPLPRSWREAFLAMLSAWDRLERWPSRWLTAHYIAIHAEKG